MKARLTAWFLAAFFLLCLIPAAAEEGAEGIVTEDWLWNPENVNTFTGTVLLSEYAGKDLTMRLSVETDPAYELTDQTLPVFTIVNGSRVRMFMQSDSYAFTPDGENPVFSFTGSIRMPEDIHVQRMKITVKALDPDGQELKSVSATVSLFGGGSGSSSGAFFIPFNIRTIALILAAAAVLVWTAALIRNRILKQSKSR